jgi:hypothetical protein
MIEQSRKGRFERMMFYALGHRVEPPRVCRRLQLPNRMEP